MTKANNNTKEVERNLFTAHAFFLWRHKDRILQDERMSHCPLHIGNNLAYVNVEGVSSNTLGGYLTWWTEFEPSRRESKGDRRSLIYFLGGSPLSGKNHCGEVYESGKTNTIHVAPFKDYWTSFAAAQEQFAKKKTDAYSLAEVIDMLKNEDATLPVEINKMEMKRRHQEYNQLYFGGKLTMPKFKFLNSGNCYGRYHCGSRDGSDPSVIYISKHMNDNENELRETLIHEMIHQYVYECLWGMKYKLIVHGIRFRYVCWQLRRKYGINIVATSIF